jgi:hypothetical protein
MSNFFQQTTPGIQRLHSDVARELDVHQYTWDGDAGENAYADGDWTETTFTVEGTLRKPDDPVTTTDVDGNDVVVDATIYVQPSAVDVSLGTSDETRATQFTDPQTGISYEAVDASHQESLLAIDCISI